MAPVAGTRTLSELSGAWATSGGGARLQAVIHGARRLRTAIEDSGSPKRVRTMDVATFPYPTEFAFFGACVIPIPYVWLHNRCLFVEYEDLDGEARRLLVNPVWVEGARRAPYFQSLLAKAPAPIRPAMERALSHRSASIPDQLRGMGVDPGSIDYITFDHLHVQHVAPMLGPSGFYPKAKLLVTRGEIDGLACLHPLQRFWYVAESLDGLSEASLAKFEGDLLLGRGVALISTPGHTEGNHTIVLVLPGGPVTISENGVSAECYAPQKSEIPGLRAYAERTGFDVILNSNTRERTLDQYTSMKLEQILADSRNDEFPRHFSSSELTRSHLAPGIKPTFSWTRIDL
jgi:hypothetical protein